MANILVIDDEANIRNMIALALQQVGHTVDSAQDGPAGLAKFGEGHTYDLVLLDQRMPEMEGLEVLRELRRRAPNARIVMITAFGTIDLAVDAMKAGATDFLRKPFTLETLRGAVESSLAPPTEPSGKGAEARTPKIIHWAAGINGYHLETKPDAGVWEDGDLIYPITVRSPSGDATECSVVIPAPVVEKIKAHAETRAADGKRFWRMLCEHIVAGQLWQNAEAPSSEVFRLTDLNKELVRFIDSLAPV